MRARTAAAGVPARGTRRDRLARALSEDWEPTRAVVQRVLKHKKYYGAIQALLEFQAIGLSERRRHDRNGARRLKADEWRRGERWQEVYGDSEGDR